LTQEAQAIVMDGLTKRFRPLRSYRDVLTAAWRSPGRAVVDDVDLSVPAGAVFGLLGQNGAGKSTLVRMLSTLLLPSAGQATVLGMDVVRDAGRIRGRIGLVNGDERSFSWRLSGRHNLEFFGALRHVPERDLRRRITTLAEVLDIDAHLDRPFGELSSGQRQKLAIIRGLLAEPDLLFMDEPTRSLDPISAVTIRTFVRDHVVGELGRTVVLATHSMPEAEALCGRVAFLQTGRVVASGTVPELRASLGDLARCELVVSGSPPDLAARLSALDAVRAVTTSTRPDATGLGFETVVDLAMRTGATIDPVLRAVMAMAVPIVRCEMREATLEELYVRTLGAPPVEAPMPSPSAIGTAA
jgi:ABC-2 type transport system ATP-binding protein